MTTFFVCHHCHKQYPMAELGWIDWVDDEDHVCLVGYEYCVTCSQELFGEPSGEVIDDDTDSSI